MSRTINIDFPTLADERTIMHKGRIACLMSVILSVFLTLYFFKLKWDFKHYWIVSKNKNLSLNVPWAAVTFGIILLIYAHIEPYFLFFRRYTIPVETDEDLNIRIAHISDIHMHKPYTTMTKNRLIRILDKVNKENPDIVCITGDLMSDASRYSMDDINSLTAAISTLKSPVYVCFGNHDEACRGALRRALESINVTILEQSTVLVKNIYLSGIAPSLNMARTAELVRGVAERKNKCHVLLAHMPDAADAAAGTGAFDVQLSGHSHGGQVVLPFRGGTPLLPPGCVKYGATAVPVYRVGRMVLVVSRGVGVTPLPFPLVRFLCPPEVGIITIRGTVASV